MDIRTLVTKLGYKVDTRGLKKGESAVGRYAQKVRRSIKFALAGVSAAVAAVGAASIKSAGEMESINAAFEVMLGSADKAQDLVKAIEAKALVTPFDFMDFSRSAKLMLNFGVAAEDIMGNIQMLGDVAGNSKERFQSLSLAFAQNQAAGRLMGQDLLQMINAGFNPLQVISKQTGRSMAELKKEMERGAISAEMVADAFRAATSEGGRFFKNMERQSDTMVGQWSKFWGIIRKVRVEIGNYFGPTIKNVLKWVNGYLEKNVIPRLESLSKTLTPFVEITDYIVATWGALVNVVKAVGAAFEPQILQVRGMVDDMITLAGEAFKFFTWLSRTLGLMAPIKAAFGVIGWVIEKAVRGWALIFKTAAKGLSQLNRQLAAEERLRDARTKKRERDFGQTVVDHNPNAPGVQNAQGQTRKDVPDGAIVKVDFRPDIPGVQDETGGTLLGPGGDFDPETPGVQDVMGATIKEVDFDPETPGVQNAEGETLEGSDTLVSRLKKALSDSSRELRGIGEVARARKEVRIQNINMKVEQKNTIKAPAAKDGTTGLSAKGLDASLRKAHRSIFGLELNKLITSSLGS
jgi:tape measure domain-containing protein